ncbi:uncharacterized protein Dana_GF22319 [Drosophila ananassae]|uniref:C2H2-type domain-containing protein n=1 Tax=Drosophila ananassae TaxID=7217 RepID=B3MW60_DROAN|nr:zinc finger protein 2 homolog [Drosophila ananassae]EDV35205.1 uncharacterized protein Dana_GF22319 [Drosophila ananassae]
MDFVAKSLPDIASSNGQQMPHPTFLRRHAPVKGETTEEEYILEEAFIRVAAENEALVKKLKRRRSEESAPGFEDSTFRVKNEPIDEEYPAYNDLELEPPASPSESIHFDSITKEEVLDFTVESEEHCDYEASEGEGSLLERKSLSGSSYHDNEEYGNEEDGSEEKDVDEEDDEVESLNSSKHSNEGPHSYRCPLCPKSFKLSKNLKKHCLTTHPPNTGKRSYQCKHCLRVYAQRAGYKKHLITHHNDKDSELESEVDTDDEKIYKCARCPKSFKYLSNLRKHARMHTSGLPFKCERCNMCFSQKARYEKHLRVPHEADGTPMDRPFKCLKCAKWFRTETDLDRHDRSHETKKKPKDILENPLEDDEGDDSELSDQEDGLFFKEEQEDSTYKYNLARTVRRHDPNWWHICPICQKSFKNATTLRRHHEVHDFPKEPPKKKEISHYCSVCGKGFPAARYLIMHMRVHTGERPFQCMHCTKNYKQRGQLSVHMKTHTGEKRHTCLQCSMTFTYKSSLQRHVSNIHSEGRPFECPECDRTFASMYRMREHRKTHTTESQRPFKCPECPMAFVSEHGRKVHKLIHLKEPVDPAAKRVKCPLCPKTFARKQGLKAHLSKKGIKEHEEPSFAKIKLEEEDATES